MKKGFTLVELLVTIGLVAILLTITLVALNPEKQFKSAREAKRMADASTLLNAVSQYVSDHKTEESTLSRDNISRYIAAGEYKGKWDLSPKPVQEPNVNLCSLLVPTYTANLPSDPILETEVANCENFDTGYILTISPEGRITISAPFSEINPIVLTR